MAMLTSRCSATTTAIHTLGTVIPTGMKASLPHAAQPSGRHQCVGLRSASSQTEEPDGLQFGKIPIPERHVFFRSEDKLSAAFVNLRPIVPGHVLVVPLRVVEREKELTEEESISLWLAMRKVNAVIEKQYKASALNLAIQDGRDAGQSIPHVHLHVLPRVKNDFERNDDVYDKACGMGCVLMLKLWLRQIDEFEYAPTKTKLEVPDDEDRRDRTDEEMANEAATLRQLF
eukprot:3708746-Rhodomonas_salina.3